METNAEFPTTPPPAPTNPVEPVSPPVSAPPPPTPELPVMIPKRKSPLGPALSRLLHRCPSSRCPRRRLLLGQIQAHRSRAYPNCHSQSYSHPEPSATPSATPKSSLKPTSAIKATPTATPFSLPSLDVRFGNPSAVVKQTIDEGAGDGRVINREYTSIQAGQFDEVKSAWSPKVTVCFHLTASEKVAGKLIKFTMTYDGKTEVEDNMSWIDELEAGRIYDWCHDVTTDIGKHSAKLTVNADKSLKEYNYANGVAEVSWENLADNVAPNFTLLGPNNEGVSVLVSSRSLLKTT